MMLRRGLDILNVEILGFEDEMIKAGARKMNWLKDNNGVRSKFFRLQEGTGIHSPADA